MEFPLEERLPYAVLTLLVLAVFYGIYFIKALSQKRRGIQTRQIGSRKEKGIHTVELLMSVATLGAPVSQLLSWHWAGAGFRPERGLPDLFSACWAMRFFFYLFCV